ncbi:MAG: amidohydrolase [Rhodospirillales bacterium]|nr:amidohydrolase [Rhodospirillales bacterium]
MSDLVDKAKSHFAACHEELVEWRLHLHRRPELAFNEVWTADFIAEKLTGFGYDVVRGLGKTGVVATLKGGEGPMIGLRADIDALAANEKNAFAHRSEHEGLMHACGHDGHITMLLAAARYLAGNNGLPGTVAFIFQPAEENEGGAGAMIRDGLFDRFPVAAVYGMHNWPGLEEGVFATRVGPQMAAFDVFEIALRGQGAHAAMPHLGTDVIVAASTLAQQIQTIVARSVNPLEGAVVSVTQIHSGDAFNVLPADAVLRGCIRHFSSAVQDLIEARMHALCDGVAAGFGIAVGLDYQRRYPVTSNSAAETAVALKAAKRIVGADRVRSDVTPSMGSEDFGFMLQVKPGCYVWLGAGDAGPGGNLHSPTYDFNDGLLAIGAAYWVSVAREGLMAARRSVSS